VEEWATQQPERVRKAASSIHHLRTCDQNSTAPFSERFKEYYNASKRKVLEEVQEQFSQLSEADRISAIELAAITFECESKPLKDLMNSALSEYTGPETSIEDSQSGEGE
jgi:hypothetical protein